MKDTQSATPGAALQPLPSERLLHQRGAKRPKNRRLK